MGGRPCRQGSVGQVTRRLKEANPSKATPPSSTPATVVAKDNVNAVEPAF